MVAKRYAQLVERQEWLHKPGYKLEQVIAFLFGLAGAQLATTGQEATTEGSSPSCYAPTQGEVLRRV